MGIRWTAVAADDLEAICNCLSEHHPSFIKLTIGQIYTAARSLEKNSRCGRPGKIEETRELVLVLLPFIIV